MGDGLSRGASATGTFLKRCPGSGRELWICSGNFPLVYNESFTDQHNLQTNSAHSTKLNGNK